VTEPVHPGNRVDLLHDGEACFAAMLLAIEGARREVLLEMYWFGSDTTGRTFADALSRKAREGVRVCVTYDAVGSFETDRAMFQGMRLAGCDVFEYHPVSPFRARFTFAGLNRRNHRKMLIVDGKFGFTGGVNIGDPWAPLEAGGLGFRDDMISIEGPAVATMRSIFLDTFRGPTRVTARSDRLAHDQPAGSSPVMVLSNHGWRRRRLIERTYLQRIRNARESIAITNSYFIPNRLVRHAMAQAVKRGVRVRVLLPVATDVTAVTYAAHRLYEWMLERGIEIYEWTHSVLHSKTAVIDGAWCTVGTHNLDHRSLAYNIEVTVVVEDPQVAGRLQRRMEQDIAASGRVDLQAWRYRSLGRRLLEKFFYAFRRLL
jgi:cardiolipin synthase A/B